MENVLTISNLDKRYGKIHAVNNLSIVVEKGSVYGILGPNGSGKTTTLGIVLGVVNSGGGSFSWFNEPNSKQNRKRIGAILEQPLFYPYLSALNNLKIVADIKQVSYDDIERVLKIVDLWERKDSKFKTFSYGMKQRLAIASALLGNPEVLIFDEPTNGLDPRGIAEIRELIIDIARQGITIILASHLLDEVQKTCSHVVVLHKGEKLFEGKVEDVLNLSNTVEVASNNAQILEIALNEFGKINEMKRNGEQFLLSLSEGITTTDLNTYLIDKGIIVSHLSVRKKSLEEQFLELLSE
ncbi:MAG TPA: ABC transporter ATP-binding protein [Bacteroidales bacterium]|nr:ABC transporter ATP-binding protein [Bacteroidales bacterium]HRX96696.1 ABC transporter ATP-binding protein [Bacteroidales bacterium]